MTITDEELSRLRMKWMIQSDERGLGGIELLDEVRDLRAEVEDLRSADRLAVRLLQIADTCVGELKAERTSLRTALRDALTKAHCFLNDIEGEDPRAYDYDAERALLAEWSLLVESIESQEGK